MLDEKLLEERLNQFNPDPLIDYDCTKTKHVIELPMVLQTDKTIDLAKTNFLDVLNNETIKNESEEIIRKYGVGTCGPRAFYGTTDVHLELEERLAAFLGMEHSIVYSYGFVAISSSIAAYCKRKDVVFVDQEVNFPIQQGLMAAKSKVVYFNHNDPNSLHEEAKKVFASEKGKKPSRKFLIIEGVSWKTGKVCPLEEFLAVAEQFKMRIFLEESYSLGVFGKTGKGLTEHFHVDPTRLDMIFGTLEAAVGSIGGFCAGAHSTIEHQRLSGSGYIFSASLPTYLVQAAIKSIELIGDGPNKLSKLAQEFHNFLENECEFIVMSDPRCPFKVFNVAGEGVQEENNKKVHEFCQVNGVQFIRTENGLVINLNVAMAEDRGKLEEVYNVLKRASKL